MDLERVVQITHAGRVCTFRVQRGASFARLKDGGRALHPFFWRIEVDGRTYRSPIRVTGDETPDFFRGMAEGAARELGL